MKQNSLLFLTILFYSSFVCAQNPIVPPGVYIADPSAHVWADGNQLPPILRKQP